MLIIDSREGDRSKLFGRVADLCDKMGVAWEKRWIEVGDYVFGDMCFEAKSSVDFLASVMNNRIWNQIDNMDREYNRNFLVIYGTLNEAVEYLNYTKHNNRQWREKLEADKRNWTTIITGKGRDDRKGIVGTTIDVLSGASNPDEVLNLFGDSFMGIAITTMRLAPEINKQNVSIGGDFLSLLPLYFL